MKKSISFILVMLMVLCMVPGVALAAEVNVTDVAGIKSALGSADPDIIINISGNITLDEKLTIPAGKNVTIKGEHSITRAATYTGTLFEIPSTAKLTLDGGLVIDGGNNWTFNETKYKDALQNRTSGTSWADYAASQEGAPALAAAMFVVDGSVNANNVTIQNSFTTKDNNGGDASIFKVNANASLTMTGANITHIATGGANSVVHLASGATWTINDGTVISNTFAGKNGGVCRNDSGTIVMNGGTIENNASINTNGTFVMLYKGTFKMNGGTICSNTGITGSANGRCAAIYLHTQGKMTMTGGTICHNTGISYGGIDAPYTGEEGNASELNISGGHVEDNISLIGNTNADVNGGTRVTITGGVFTQDISQWLGNGVEPPIKGSDGKYYVGADMKNAPIATPAPRPSGSGISITYNGGNSFSTSKSDVPTGVEIDNVPVSFTGNGSSFTVSDIPANAKWITVRWNSTSVTTNFTPNGAYFAEVEIPKTGDMPFWAAIAEFLGF